jgi:SNF2 family DNA or RNA helicase
MSPREEAVASMVSSRNSLHEPQRKTEQEEFLGLFNHSDGAIIDTFSDPDLESRLRRCLLDDDEDMLEESATNEGRVQNKKVEFLEQALDLIRTGALCPPMTTSNQEDFTRTPNAITEAEWPMELYPYQRAGAGRMESLLQKYGAALLSWEMGLGKTITVVGQFYCFCLEMKVKSTCNR